jgi:glucose-1-phosphate adenylyltransferase
MEDAETHGSKRDFGGDIVPRMIADGARVYSHRFDGYWRDVGTIQSYWDANMELLAEPPGIDLYDRSWLIHTKTEGRALGYVGSGATVEQSLVSHGSRIHGHVQRSVLSPGVVIEEGAIVRDSIVMFDSVIGRGAVLDRAIVDKEVEIGAHAYIGWGDDMTVNELEPQRINTGITLVGKRAMVPEGARIGRNCRIDPNVEPADFETLDVVSGRAVSHAGPER